jgi:hypothetical protein
MLYQTDIQFSQGDIFMGVNHGGGRIPQNFAVGDTNTGYPPQIFVIFQNFKRSPWIRPPQISTQIYATGHIIIIIIIIIIIRSTDNASNAIFLSKGTLSFRTHFQLSQRMAKAQFAQHR